MTGEPAGAPGEGDDPLLGAVVAGRYRLIEKIGEGGMGSVYRGVHETLRKPVALKLLGRAARNDREMVTRFEREAVAAANLKHPNIVEATDSGQMPDGTLFLVMEYVEGRSLRAVLTQEGRLAPARALHILRQIASAAAFAHGRDVVHRDLKPENVVLFDRGEEHDVVKVIDFGIARMKSSFGGGASGLTRVGTVVGTAEYMAPEQAMGQTVDGRADQYSLGVIAYELLTGRAPFVAEDMASLVYMHVGAPVPRVTEHATDLPDTVDDVIATMMGKLPDERFPTVTVAITALAGALQRPLSMVDGGGLPSLPNLPSLPGLPGVPGVDHVAITSASSPIVLPYPTAAATPFAVASPFSVASPAQGPVLTARGTIVSPERPAAMPFLHGKSARGGQRRELPIVVIASSIVSLIGLIIVISLVVSRCGASASDSTPGSVSSGAPGDGPATLAPSSREHGNKPKPKGKGRR